MRAHFQRANLAFDGVATVNGFEFQAFFELSNAAQLFGYLHGQLAGWAKHQYLRALVGNVNLLEGRNTKGGGFARACLGLAQHIATLQKRRNGLGLDWGGFFKTHFGYGFQDFVRKAQ